MKNKIVFLLIFTIIFNTSFAFADDNLDNYYYIDNRSGSAVVVGGAVASSILALATKLGIEFATGDEMDKFVRDFISDNKGLDIVKDIAQVIGIAGAGIIGLPASIVTAFTHYVNKQSLANTSFTFLKATVDGKEYSIPVFPYKFSDKSTYGGAGWTLFRNVADSLGTDVSVEFRNNNLVDSKEFEFPNIVLGFKNRGSDILKAYGSPGDTFANNGLMGYTRSWNTNSRAKCFIFGEATSSGTDFEIKLGSVFYNPATGIQYGSASYTSLPYSRYWKKNVFGDALQIPSDISIPDNIVKDPGATDIAIPLNPNDLIGKSPSDVTTTPNYDVWEPGSTVVPPATDNPSVEYVPEIVVPDKPVDIPTDKPSDTPTDKPSDDNSSISWDWLKNLLELIKGLIQTIVDWLTNFWDNLLEFLKSLLIPSANYWVDTLADILTAIKNKIPDIDIDLLEELAVNEKPFEDIYARFFGIECLVVRGSVVNEVVSWIKPIIQGLMALFLLLYNYNQVYKLIRGGSLVGSTCTNDERGR